MKIIIRHERVEYNKPIGQNLFSLLSDDGIKRILETRKQIARLFSNAKKEMPTRIYASYRDCTIETAQILLDGNAEWVKAARICLFELVKTKKRVGHNWSDFYSQMGLERKFPRVIMDSSLETHVSPRLLVHDDAIIVVHEPVAESFDSKLKLEEGQFSQIDIQPEIF